MCKRYLPKCLKTYTQKKFVRLSADWQSWIARYFFGLITCIEQTAPSTFTMTNHFESKWTCWTNRILLNPGERVLATRFNVTFLPSRPCYDKIRTCFSKVAESLTTFGYVLWCSQIVCIHPYSWTLQSHFTLWISAWTLQCLIDWWRVMSQCVCILPRLDLFRNWHPTPQ